MGKKKVVRYVAKVRDRLSGFAKRRLTIGSLRKIHESIEKDIGVTLRKEVLHHFVKKGVYEEKAGPFYTKKKQLTTKWRTCSLLEEEEPREMVRKNWGQG